MALAEWAEEHDVMLEFIKPGKPMQNGSIERFNRSYRQAELDMYLFHTLNEVQEQTKNGPSTGLKIRCVWLIHKRGILTFWRQINATVGAMDEYESIRLQMIFRTAALLNLRE